MGRNIRNQENTGELDEREAEERLAAERERAQGIGFLELAKQEAQENAEALRLLAKH